MRMCTCACACACAYYARACTCIEKSLDNVDLCLSLCVYHDTSMHRVPLFNRAYEFYAGGR